MSIEGLDWQTIQIPFVGGLNTKPHEHALEAPDLLVAQNVEFDEVGGLRLRKPFVAMGANVYPSGALSNVRKFAIDGNELLCFTETELYSWSDVLQKWVSRGEHLAVKVDEATRFGNTSDQVFADRAELGTLIVYVWVESQVGGIIPYLAALDAATGAPVISPTSLGATRSKPRVVALETVILVYFLETGVGLLAQAIDPSAPTFTPGGSLVVANVQPYDVVKVPGADVGIAVSRNAAGTTYTVARTANTGITTATSAKVRTCDGIVALSCAPAAADRVQILRTSGNSVVGDLLNTTTLADVFTATAIGGATTTINQLTGAHRSTTDGGFYRCYVFWSAGETTGTVAFLMESNWIDTNNSVGTEATFVLRQGVASRAFERSGRIYVWTVFSGESIAAGMGVPLGIRAQLQSSYFLYRDDAFLVACAAWTRAGGFGYYSGHLPGVAGSILATPVGGLAFCGIERQIIVTGGTDHTAYGARAPRDIVFAFDADEARQTVKLGRTLYVAGGLILQYDGEGLIEVGFLQYPWLFATVALGGGAIAAGAYSYKATLRWENARGETERSTTATGEQITLAANQQTDFSIASIHVTKKQGSRRKAALEIWRTKVAPVPDSPFYLVTGKDPAVSTGDNCYIENDPAAGFSSTAFGEDNFTDATLGTKEQNAENAGVLVRLAPPPATIIVANDTRVFLAGVSGEPYRIWYSLQRNDLEIAAFHPACSISLPSFTGPITALAFLNETLIAFTSNAIWALPGDGFDNLGGGSNYGPPRLISSDIGAWKRSLSAEVPIGTTPVGLIFQSRKGFYRLGRGWDLEYIGAPIEGFNDDQLVAVSVNEYQHQVRFLTDGRMLVWDYLVNRWSEWTQANGRDLAIWDGQALLLDTAPKSQGAVDQDVTYSMVIETSWIKLNGLQGYGRVRWFEILGEFKADCELQIQVYRDYQSAAFDDKSIDVTVGVGQPAQVRHSPTQQRLQAIKVRITVRTTAGGVPANECVTLTGVALEVGIKRGLYRRLPAAQKQ